LDEYITDKALFCSVHKTHYGLPQAGALSQQRLVVDDFAVVWNDKNAMDHLIHTLTTLYQVKVNWLGTKYLGMDIDINRKRRRVTLTMPGYIDKLLRKVRPNGIKGASTPAHYTPPNYAKAGQHTATVDLAPLASEDEKKLLQCVVGTLLYYSRAVDPTICTAVHELGPIQSKPTTKDMVKMDRLLGYVSRHCNIGVRYYASNMILQLMSDASYLCRPGQNRCMEAILTLGPQTRLTGLSRALAKCSTVSYRPSLKQN
jgi:hypothetical protein